ncbi:MAG: M28 family peptidase [Pseudomonadales bacterium]
MNDRIASILSEYDAQGIHRTGTDVDNDSARWLADKIRLAGVQPVIDAFSFKRVHVLDARLRVSELDIKGVPLFDCTYTDERGITGRLGKLGSKADIGVAMALPFPRGELFSQIASARKSNIHKAIVLVTDETMPSKGVATLNAESFQNPYGPPVLQIANSQWVQIRTAVTSGQIATVIAHCEYLAATAKNVQAYMPGKRRGTPPLVVMTPRSGWWTCASERGGGIAAFLEIMRAIKQSGHTRDIIFTANTGHELGHTGLDHFLEANPSLIKDAHLWIHLGANIAAKQGGGLRLQYSDEPARSIAAHYLKSESIEPTAVTPIGTLPFGEARNIFDGGGRYISILGSNNLFHHPADQWPDAVDLGTTTRCVRALSSMAVDLSN